MKISIEHLTALDRCESVFAVYRRDSGNLGFMPKGAFEEGIRNRRLLVALDEHGRLAGYLLYRTVGRRISITHLCVDRDFRGKNIASSLVTKLKEVTWQSDAITLKCREDLAATRLWPKLGFVAKGSTIGRGADRARLTVWHLDHGHPDLFSYESPKTRVAIDANVFYDLWAKERPMAELSKALLEPWVEEIIELCLTAEIYNDIQRAACPEIRDLSKSMVTQYEEVRAPALEVDRILPRLRTLYPKSVILNERDESDIRHLAYTIASGVKYFATRDEGLLAKSGDVLQSFDVNVLTPVELVSHLDWIEREDVYQPLRLEGSNVKSVRADARMINELIESFRDAPSERIIDLQRSLERSIASPKNHEVKACRTADGSYLAMIASQRCEEGVLDITLVREGRHQLGPTVIRHMLMQLVHECVETGIFQIRITDKGYSRLSTSAIEEVGFKLINETWIKPVTFGFFTFDELWRSFQATPSLIEILNLKMSIHLRPSSGQQNYRLQRYPATSFQFAPSGLNTFSIRI